MAIVTFTSGQMMFYVVTFSVTIFGQATHAQSSKVNSSRESTNQCTSNAWKHSLIVFFFFKNGPIPASFSVYFRLFNTLQFKFNKFKLKKAQMVCLGFEPGAAGWKARTNPLSYGGTPSFLNCLSFRPTMLFILFCYGEITLISYIECLITPAQLNN